MQIIVLTSSFKHDEYTDYIIEKFDLQAEDSTTTAIPNINREELDSFDWNIGLIVGNSGSGKSTILNTFGKQEEFQYDYTKPIISQFPHMAPKEVVELFCGVGLSSVPTWLLKPQELSTGQRARFDICSILAFKRDSSGFVLLDEFTSVLNRECSKSLAYALQRYVRKHDIKIVIASCHFDIIEWLQPDWVFNLNLEENGEVELVKMIYKDDKTVNVTKRINSNESLSEARELCEKR